MSFKREAKQPSGLRQSVVRILSSEDGQIALEYVLLLVVGVSVWMMLTTGLVSRSAANPGLLVGKWKVIIDWISSSPIEK